MPNGGMGPCCFICDFAEHTEPRSLMTPLHCRQHAIQVWLPYKHVCGCLTYHGEILPFIEEEQVQADTVYAEIEVQYQNPAYPTLPQYYHELHVLAPVAVYRQWTLEEKQAYYDEIAQRVEADFIRRYVDPPAEG
jgi:hypothetical protein